MEDRADSASSSSYLVHSETNSQPLGEEGASSLHPLACQSRAQFRIHAPVRKLREQTINALYFSEDPRLIHRARKIALCSIAPTVYVGRGCTPTCSPGRCRDRLCPTCAMFRAGTLRTRLRKLIFKASAVRLVTLTMAPVSTELGKCVDALQAAMRRLRATKVWKQHVKGGAFVVEVTRGRDGGIWHVHAHLLVDGVYWAHSSLHEAWSEAVGSRSRVEIQALHDREGIAGYLAKYLAKGTAADEWSHEEICEFALEMHRRRTVGTFGSWHRCKVDVLDEEPVKPPKADAEIDFVVVEEVFLQDKGLARAVAPLLSRLSRTWRLLLEPYREGLEWLDAPLGGNELEVLTECLLEVRSFLLTGPVDPTETRREAARAAVKARVRDARRQGTLPLQHPPHLI